MKAPCVLASLVVLGFAVSVAQPKALTLVKDESSVVYRLIHPLHKIEAASKDVEYKVDADIASRSIKKVFAVVDVMTFSSGNSNRDSHAMEVIDAISYPEAKFVSTSITQNGDSLTVHGDLTFHGMTKEAIMKGVSRWSANKLVVEGSFDVSLTAFNIERPSLLMIPVEDALSFSIVAVFGLNASVTQ